MLRPNRIAWVLIGVFLIGGVIFTIVIPEIWIGQIWITVALALALYYLVMKRRADRGETLIREGIAGHAEILELTQTGTYVNQQPRVRLKLRIEAPGVASFDSEDTYTVPLVALGTLTGGRKLPVHLDPANSKRFVIDWFGSAEGARGQVELNGSPEIGEAILETLRAHGIDPKGTIDLREQPAARAAVLDALARHGIDVAHGVAVAAPAAPVEQPAEPIDRLQKLTQLKRAHLITDEEFEKHRARILGEL